VLDRSDLELRNALRLQIKALEEKPALLSRAIHTIRFAELAIEAGKSAAPAPPPIRLPSPSCQVVPA
jgi:hypothetical protein